VQRVGPCTLTKHNVVVFVLARQYREWKYFFNAANAASAASAAIARDVIYTARKDQEDILSPFRSGASEITDKKFRFPVN
jgi:hypothetical protein